MTIRFLPDEHAKIVGMMRLNDTAARRAMASGVVWVERWTAVSVGQHGSATPAPRLAASTSPSGWRAADLPAGAAGTLLMTLLVTLGYTLWWGVAPGSPAAAARLEALP